MKTDGASHWFSLSQFKGHISKVTIAGQEGGTGIITHILNTMGLKLREGSVKE